VPAKRRWPNWPGAWLVSLEFEVPAFSTHARLESVPGNLSGYRMPVRSAGSDR
jgi:hypothetical protein